MPDPSAAPVQPTPSSVGEALAMVESAWDFLNGDDVAGLPVATLAECLCRWHRLEAKQAAAAIRLAGAFDAADGPAADGQRSQVSWLTLFGRITRAAARAWVSRARRLRGHRIVCAALAEGSITVSVGEWIAEALGGFPIDDRGRVEQILVDAAVGGVLIEDLADLAARMFRLLMPDGPERQEQRHDDDRRLTLGRTLDGVGRLNADLNRRATALAEQVINALAVRKGPEDTRTAPQRRHDALADAFQRLIDSDLLPQRGGVKPHLRVDIPLVILRKMRGSPEAEARWVREKAAEMARSRMTARTATETVPERTAENASESVSERAFERASEPASERGSESVSERTGVGSPEATHEGGNEFGGRGAVLSGIGPVSDRLAGALACDSVLSPTVTGQVDRRALVAMTDHWLSAHALAGRGRCPAGDGCRCDCHHPVGAETHERTLRTLLRWAVEVLSGPDGLASYLRRTARDRDLNGRSIVLDVGADTRTVPAPLERAVRSRDRVCRFPGCDHPAELSQVHHMVHRALGGPTRLDNLITMCGFHHLIAVHSWGWSIRLDPEGTAVATSPESVDLYERPPPEAQPPHHAA